MFDSISLPCTLSTRTDCLRHRSQSDQALFGNEIESDNCNAATCFRFHIACGSVWATCAPIRPSSAAVRLLQPCVQNHRIAVSST